MGIWPILPDSLWRGWLQRSVRRNIYQCTTHELSANLISREPKTDFSHSKGSPFEQILFLQRTIGNQAVRRFIKSGALQTKLRIGQPGDMYEQEADRVAEKMVQMPDLALQSQVNSRPVGSLIQSSASYPEKDAPPIVHEVLSSPGHMLDPATREYMELRFGHDFSRVRVHSDAAAGQSAESVAAQAFTVGADVVFGAGRYAPETRDGQRLIAHEMAHVVQQRGAGANSLLQRFHLPHGPDPKHQVDETPQIAPTLNDMLATIKAIITASTQSGWPDTVAMETFISNAGGFPFTKELDKKLGTKSTPSAKSMLNYRYLFTCRCGLIDMRHFLQMLYLSNFVASMSPGIDANRVATRKGKEHELSAESESRFGPEDTPSNALGAFTATNLAAYPRPGPLFNAIKATLSRCDPIGFKSLSAASQDMVKHFYGDLVPDPKKTGDLIPKHQNLTAVPDVLGIKECGGAERSFPFSLDTDDADKKTISGMDFEKGSTELKSGSDIRDFINTQRREVLKELPTSEKIRMLKVLLGGTVTNEDLDAASLLSKMMTPAEKAIWQRHLPLPTED